MGAVEFRGEPGDLERFARHVVKQPVVIDTACPFEQLMQWQTCSHRGSSTFTSLRSGIRLTSTRIDWDRPWAFQFREQPTPLKFVLARGPSPVMTSTAGSIHTLGDSAVQVRHSTSAVDTTCEFLDGGHRFEQLALEVAPDKLRELLGGEALPSPLEALLAGTGGQDEPDLSWAPAVSRVADEILHLDARGAARRLLLEAKGLELLAALVDNLELVHAARSPLGAGDIERLERARRLLLARIAAPPSVPELARLVGLNEVKLKTGFKTLFGTPPFAYLRAQRMEVARRLLAEGGPSVTEVAARVGYDNPSKFAAAFRKHFGFPPSASRSRR